jgi:glycosyltransferase involved in cell wall biosynthesis
MNNSGMAGRSQLRIGHFCFALDSSKGGVPSGVSTCIVQLNKYGILNQIFSMGNTKDQIIRNSPNLSSLAKAGVDFEYSLTRIPNDYGIGSLMGFNASLSKFSKSDLIVLHQVYTLSTFFGYRYAKKNGIPYAVFPHGSLTRYHESDGTFKKSIAKRIVFSRILRSADAIIVTCESERSDLEEDLQCKAVLLPFGAEVTQEFFERQSIAVEDSKYIRILFSGRFDKKKNLPLLMAAMPLIVSVFPELILDVTGSGSEGARKALTKLVHDLNIEKNVVFHGWVDKSEMGRLFRSASLLILPSENENFALVVSEALSSGLPCVVSQFVGTSDIVARHHAGEIIEELTRESVAAAVLKVLNGDQLAYRKAAFKAARDDLDWSKIALKWKAMIGSLVVE